MSADARQLRQQLRALRRALDGTQRQQAAQALIGHLVHWPVWAAAVHIAGYWACDGELDPAPLLEHAWAAGRQVYLPVLRDDHGLGFAPYRPDTPLHRNRFQIPEPAVSAAHWLEPAQLDVVLTPLLAFDRTGTRLGMGGGFYDRAFAFLRDPAYNGHRPTLLGLGYQCQQTAFLVRQPWDVPLDAVLTEQALHLFTDASARNSAGAGNHWI